ncbi:LuxR C-terminal-related transcriptional regulator [Herbiconiux sp. YIM B11900]|uniref:helix-turn-helix transcriptional regulator n=1 Tax=Herbiconiux sp. YIM B11900 TaxID=3404131 RepID=UPI003F8526D3
MPGESFVAEAWEAWKRRDTEVSVRRALDAHSASLRAEALSGSGSTAGAIDRGDRGPLRLACYFALRGRRVGLLLPYLDAVRDLPVGVLRDGALSAAAVGRGDLTAAAALALSTSTAPDDVEQVNPDDSGAGLRAALLAEVTLASVASGSWTLARECAEAAREVLNRIHPVARDPETTYDLLGLDAIIEFHTASGETAFTALVDAVGSLRARNSLTGVHALALIGLGDLQHMKGRLGEAALDLTRGAKLADPARPGLATHALIELAFVRVRQGRWADAADVVRKTIVPLGAIDHDWLEPQVLSIHGLLLALSGDLDTAAPILEHGALLARDIPSYLASIVLLHARIATAIARNDWQELSHALDDAGDPGYRHPYPAGEWNALKLLAAWHLGNRTEFGRRLTEWSLTAESGDNSYYWAFAAIKAEHERRYADGMRAVERALESVSPDDDPLGRAWVRIVAGTYISRHGDGGGPDPVRALGVYEEANAELRQLGAATYARLCEGIITRTTAELERAREIHPSAVLTEQQHRIAMAVAQGYTSDEIASIQHLSKRTIDYHVTNILRRLGISNRREIARVLAHDTDL